MISTKTSDLLCQMSHRLQSISDALYEHKHIARSTEIAGIASMLNQSAGLLEKEITDYAAEMMKDTSHD